MKLGTKLVIAFLAVALAPFIVLGVMSLQTSQHSLTEGAFSQLSGVRDISKARIDNLFGTLQEDMHVMNLTAGACVDAALNRLESIQLLKKKQVEQFLVENKNSIQLLSEEHSVEESLADLQAAFTANGNKIGSAEWEAASMKYDDYFSKVAKSTGLADLMIINGAGDILYSVRKGSELGTNLTGSELSKTGLGLAYRDLTQSKDTAFSMQDITQYPPAQNSFEIFMMAIVKDETGTIEGFVAGRPDMKIIDDMIHKDTSSTEASCETYISGKKDDKISFRTNLRTMGDGKYIVGYELTTLYISSAIDGKILKQAFLDSRGKPVLVTGNLIDFPGIQWAMITKLDVEDIVSPKLAGQEKDYYAQFVETYGYANLLLIHPDKGMVFYAVKHNKEYDTPLLDGPYSNTNLGQGFAQVLKTREFTLADTALYPADGNTPNAFALQPILNDKGDIHLILALQIPVKWFNDIVSERSGLGKTGQMYLVGSDKKMRSDSQKDPENRTVQASLSGTVEKNGVDTESAKKALAGETGIGNMVDFAGDSVLSAYTPIKAGNTTWALLVDLEEIEAFAAVAHLQKITALVFIIGVVAIVLIALIITRSITRPVLEMVGGLQKVAAGDLTVHVDIKTKDEIGTMGAAVNEMVDNLSSVVRDIGDAAEQTATSSEELSASAQNISAGAEEQASTVEEISASMEELTASIQQVARNSQDATNLAEDTKSIADKGNETVKRSVEGMTLINESSNQIRDMSIKMCLSE